MGKTDLLIVNNKIWIMEAAFFLLLLFFNNSLRIFYFPIKVLFCQVAYQIISLINYIFGLTTPVKDSFTSWLSYSKRVKRTKLLQNWKKAKFLNSWDDKQQIGTLSYSSEEKLKVGAPPNSIFKRLIDSYLH